MTYMKIRKSRFLAMATMQNFIFIWGKWNLDKHVVPTQARVTLRNKTTRVILKICKTKIYEQVKYALWVLLEIACAFNTLSYKNYNFTHGLLYCVVEVDEEYDFWSCSSLTDPLCVPTITCEWICSVGRMITEKENPQLLGENPFQYKLSSTCIAVRWKMDMRVRGWRLTARASKLHKTT